MNNNNWIEIKSKDDLPKEKGVYWITELLRNGKLITETYYIDDGKWWIDPASQDQYTGSTDFSFMKAWMPYYTPDPYIK